jgi:ATP-binding protein involved in chromosome partitioning
LKECVIENTFIHSFTRGENNMRIAIPIAAGRLAMHFGHCETFALMDIDPEAKEILNKESVIAPNHHPGVLPDWLASRGVNLVIAGGMGSRARGLFINKEIDVLVGAPVEEPDVIVKAYLEGTLDTGDNVCDH